MRRSAAAIVGVATGMLIGAAFVRRRGANAERADLYFEDGSMLSLSSMMRNDRIAVFAVSSRASRAARRAR